MKIMIDIPEEFICDYEADRFEDCFQRFICDSKVGLMAGNYERETAEMLIKAFRDAKEVIRCKDCKHSRTIPAKLCNTDDDWMVCNFHGRAVVEDDFCSWGKWKKNETN